MSVKTASIGLLVNFCPLGFGITQAFQILKLLTFFTLEESMRQLFTLAVVNIVWDSLCLQFTLGVANIDSAS